jgi:hypothetical protein
MDMSRQTLQQPKLQSQAAMKNQLTQLLLLLHHHKHAEHKHAELPLLLRQVMLKTCAVMSCRCLLLPWPAWSTGTPSCSLHWQVRPCCCCCQQLCLHFCQLQTATEDATKVSSTDVAALLLLLLLLAGLSAHDFVYVQNVKPPRCYICYTVTA